MILFKDGVSFEGGIHPAICAALYVAHEVYTDHNAPELVVTSVRDGKHMKNSLHYQGCAVDLRIWNLPQHDDEIVAEELSEALGEDFDVVLEETHIHMEYDPDD